MNLRPTGSRSKTPKRVRWTIKRRVFWRSGRRKTTLQGSFSSGTARVQANAKRLCDNRFKVSAAASVGASALLTEVSAGHPHPVPATNNANRFRYRRRKVRNHNGFRLFSYQFSQLFFIDIQSPKRLSGRTRTK